MRFSNFSKQSINEGYDDSNWGIKDPHQIRTYVIERFLHWFEEEGKDEWENGFLPELLASYVKALNINTSESPQMAALMKKAVKLCVEQYQDLQSEDYLVEHGLEYNNHLENLKKLGIFPDLLSALQKSIVATVKSDLAKWEKENPDKLDEHLSEKEVWDQPNPKKKHKKLSPAKKSAAKARAKRAGRPYPNLIDNMWASKK